MQTFIINIQRQLSGYILIIILIFLVLNCINASDITPVEKNAKSLDGSEINYIVEGSGSPALVFVHGWNMNSSYWKNQIEHFKDNFKVVAIDLAGYGKSSKQRENYTMEAFGKDVKAVVDNENLDEIILIGHSMGGIVVLEAATLLGDKVIGIVGADTFQDLSAKYQDIQLESILNPIKNNYKKHCPNFVNSIFDPDADSTLVQSTRDDMCSVEYKIAFSAFKNLFTYYAPDALQKLHIPIISINTDRFPVSIVKNKEVAPTFELKLMSNVGHFVMIEDPITFNKLLDETILEITGEN